MKLLHLPELSYPARIRRNKFVIWFVMLAFIWVALYMIKHPDRVRELAIAILRVVLE